MKDFTAGDKAILNKKYVVTINEIREDGKSAVIEYSNGLVNLRPVEILDKCYTVRILSNGNAKQVNPCGDKEPKQDYKSGDVARIVRWKNDVERWRKAESSLIELPYNIPFTTTMEMKLSHPPKHFDWYAYLSDDHFVLVEPVK